MFGQFRGHGIPSLPDYQSADKWQAKIKPIRGRSVECKPLGDRKASHYNIRKEGEDIMVRVYSTDIITYKPDGTILLQTGGYSTDTTHKVMAAVFGWHHLHPHTYQSRTWVKAYNTDGVLGWYQLHGDVPTVLTSERGNYYTIHNPATVFTHVIDRKAMKVARAKYAPFKGFLDSFIALGREDLKREWHNSTYEAVRVDLPAFRAAFNVEEHRHAQLQLGYLGGYSAQDERNKKLNELMLSDDTADHYKAALLLCVSTIPAWQNDPTHAVVKEVKWLYDRAFMVFNRDEVLREKVAPAGKQTKDRWAAYF